MVSLRLFLSIIYEDSFAIFLKQYPFVFTSNRSAYLYLTLISTKTSFHEKKYTGDTGQRRQDYMSLNITSKRCAINCVHFIHTYRTMRAWSKGCCCLLLNFRFEPGYLWTLPPVLFFLVCTLITISLESNLLRNKKIFEWKFTSSRWWLKAKFSYVLNVLPSTQVMRIKNNYEGPLVLSILVVSWSVCDVFRISIKRNESTKNWHSV